MSPILKNIPNIPTISRIFLAPIFFLLFINNYNYLALFCFFFASVTDFLDGFLARKFNIVSKFGKLYDPLADKVLIFLGCLCIVIDPPFSLMYTGYQYVPPITGYFSYIFNLDPNIIVYLILAFLLFRDFIATTLREIKLRKDGFILKTNFIAKIKTTILIISIHLYLLYQLLGDSFLLSRSILNSSIAIKNHESQTTILLFFDYCLYLTLIFSLISLIDYINQYRSKSI